MFRFVLKRRRRKKSLKRLLFFYKHYQTLKIMNTGNKYLHSIYYMINVFSLPTRQQFFNFLNCKIDKSYNISTGVFLIDAGYKVKFYKRSYLSSATLILYLRRYYSGWLKYIYLLIIKNFNYRQVIFFRKLISLMKINIYYLSHNRSYIPRFFPKRRVKRRILRLIGFQ